MKRTILSCLTFFAVVGAEAQWVSDVTMNSIVGRESFTSVKVTIPGMGSEYSVGGGFSVNNVEVVADGCTGTYVGSVTCTLKLRRLPPETADVRRWLSTYTFTLAPVSSPNDSIYFEGFSVYGSASIVNINDANPPPPAESLCFSGSIVRVDGQSLGEQVPIVGTKFNLSYSTEFAQSYIAPNGLPSGLSFFNPNGWTIDAHHFFDASKRRLYKGSGT